MLMPCIRPGNGSTDNHRNYFTAEISELFKSSIYILKYNQSAKSYLSVKYLKPDFSVWIVCLPICFPAPKDGKWRTGRK